MSEPLVRLFGDHLAIVSDRYDRALERADFDAVIIGAGVDRYRFRDDLIYPFVVNPYVKQWAPLTAHPSSGIVYRPGATPQLIFMQPDDYWHQPPALPDEPWSEFLDILTVTNADQINQIWQQVSGRVARIGDPAQWPHDTEATNPTVMLNYLDYYRPYKTAFERECIRRANRLSAPAHVAVSHAFKAGTSEYEMLLRFLATSEHTQHELPYPAIIATNRNCATLHYQHYAREHDDLHSLLIDAGCQVHGYAADISRSYSFADQSYANMIADLDREQRTICTAVAPGISFVALHRQAHEAVARLLTDWGLANGDADSLVETGITRAFMPHGLGHYLGQQVHELGGLLANQNGDEIDRPEDFPNLRLARTLETDQVLTIEPGIYFIDSLLRGLKESANGKRINWERVNDLRRYGGMRIEDNLVVTASSSENLTRQAFAAL